MDMDNMNISTEETEENRKRKKKNCSQQKKRNRIFKAVGGRAIFHATGRERERERGVEFQRVRRCRNISYPRLREPSIPFSIIEVSLFRYDSARSRRSASLVNEAAIRLG